MTTSKSSELMATSPVKQAILWSSRATPWAANSSAHSFIVRSMFIADESSTIVLVSVGEIPKVATFASVASSEGARHRKTLANGHDLSRKTGGNVFLTAINLAL